MRLQIEGQKDAEERVITLKLSKEGETVSMIARDQFGRECIFAQILPTIKEGITMRLVSGCQSDFVATNEHGKIKIVY